MRITLRRLDDSVHLEAVNEAGSTIQADGAPAIGGNNRGMRPMELLLSALATCSAMDVITFLEKMRQPLADIRITVEGKRDPTMVPSLFTGIHLDFQLVGTLDPSKAERAIRLSVDKYCSVARHLEGGTSITWSYSILPQAD